MAVVGARATMVSVVEGGGVPAMAVEGRADKAVDG